MPHENKFPDRAHTKNKLPVQTKFDSPHPFSESNGRDKLSVAHCALRVAPFTTSLNIANATLCKFRYMYFKSLLLFNFIVGQPRYMKFQLII